MLRMWKVELYGQKLLGKAQGKSSRNTAGVSKRKWRTVSSQLASNNIYSVLHPEKLGNKLNFINTTERVRDIQRTLRLLREVWLKVELEKLENHEGVAVKALLDSGATGLFMDMTFAKEKGFKMEKLKKPLLVRNVDGTVNVGRGHNTLDRVQYVLQRTYGEGKNRCVQFGQNGVDTGNAMASSP